MKKIFKYRGLYKISGWIFISWGSVAGSKGLLDAFFFNPDSEFISIDKWIKYGTFEFIYGLFCLIFGLLLFNYSKYVKEFIEIDEEDPEYKKEENKSI